MRLKPGLGGGSQDDERADEPAEHRKPAAPADGFPQKRYRQRGDEELEAGEKGVHFGQAKELDGVGEEDDFKGDQQSATNLHPRPL